MRSSPLIWLNSLVTRLPKSHPAPRGLAPQASISSGSLHIKSQNAPSCGISQTRSIVRICKQKRREWICVEEFLFLILFLKIGVSFMEILQEDICPWPEDVEFVLWHILCAFLNFYCRVLGNCAKQDWSYHQMILSQWDAQPQSLLHNTFIHESVANLWRHAVDLRNATLLEKSQIELEGTKSSPVEGK